MLGQEVSSWSWHRGQVLCFDISDFRRSHVVNVRAPSCCFSVDELFGLPAEPPAETLVLSPHRHLAGEQCCRHCGKVHHRHRHPGTVREEPVELLQREEFEGAQATFLKGPSGVELQSLGSVEFGEISVEGSQRQVTSFPRCF